MRTISAILCLCLLGFALPAFAEEPDDEAFEHFDAGAKLYFDGDFSAAIAAFREGYAIQQHPMFQVNIALGHWRLGQLDKAIDAADIAAEGSADLGPNIAAQNAARRAAFSIVRVTSRRALAIEQARDAAAIAAAQIELEAPAEPVKRQQALSSIGWIGVGTAALGVVTLVGWSVAESGLSDDVRRLEAAGKAGDRAAYDEAQDDVRKGQTAARILVVSGAVLTAAGGGLLLFDLLAEDSDSSVALGFGADGMPVFSWRQRF